MSDHWESDIAELLQELSSTQSELLALLAEKRERIVAGDQEGLKALQAREHAYVERLQQCQHRRHALLDQAATAGLPADSIESLAATIPANNQSELKNAIHDSKKRARLLQHHSLANWVLIQRTLLHLSQMIEIIATGSPSRPTYEKGQPRPHSGSLVDQEA